MKFVLKSKESLKDVRVLKRIGKKKSEDRVEQCYSYSRGIVQFEGVCINIDSLIAHRTGS